MKRIALIVIMTLLAVSCHIQTRDTRISNSPMRPYDGDASGEQVCFSFAHSFACSAYHEPSVHFTFTSKPQAKVIILLDYSYTNQIDSTGILKITRSPLVQGSGDLHIATYYEVKIVKEMVGGVQVLTAKDRLGEDIISVWSTAANEGLYSATYYGISFIQ